MPNTALRVLLEAFAIAASPEYARQYASRSTSGAKTALAEADENRFPDASESRARVFATNRKNSGGSDDGGANQRNHAGAWDRMPGSATAWLSAGEARS
jgi:hypothetical protein